MIGLGVILIIVIIAGIAAGVAIKLKNNLIK